MGALAVMITGLALGLVDAAVNGAYKGTTGKKIKQMVDALKKAIDKDVNLKNRLTDAYNTKNYNLVNNIMTSVPGGLAHKVSTLEKQVKEQTHADNMKTLDDNISDNTRKLSKWENSQMGDNSITNAINQAHYDQSSSAERNPTNKDINEGEFWYTDVYGNKRKGNRKSLNKFVYGEDQVSNNQRQFQDKGSSTNEVIRKV